MEIAKDAIISIAAGISQIALLRTLKDEGFSIIGVDRNPNAEGFKYCIERIIKSTHEAMPIIRELDILNAKWTFLGVLTQSDGYPVITAAKIAEHYQLRYISSSIAETVVDKGALLSALNEKGVPAPQIIVVSRRDITDVGFFPPFFVKPSISFKTHTGMLKVEGLNYLSQAIANALDASANGRANIEQYIPGKDLVSIDLVFNKEIIHVATIEEINSGEPHFYGLGWKMPLSTELENAARILQEQFIHKFDIDYSLVSTAMKFDGKKAFIIEIHLDLGGDGVPDILLPYSLKYNLTEQMIRLALGVHPSGPNITAIPTYFRFILNSEIKGAISKFMMDVVNKFNARPVEFNGLKAFMDNEQRIAAIIFQAETIEELNSNISEFENWIKRGFA